MQLYRQGSFGTFISNTHVNNCLLTEVAQHVRHTQRRDEKKWKALKQNNISRLRVRHKKNFVLSHI